MQAVAAQEIVTVILNEDAKFLYPQGDPYWSIALVNGVYEPEISLMLLRAADRPYAMIDAGANYGFWSALASSAPYGSHPTLAIEPSTTNFECLRRNANANGDRFQILRRAIFDESGKCVTLYGKKPGGLSLRTDWHPADIDSFEDNIETITLDEVAELYLPRREYPPIIKLDAKESKIRGIKGPPHLTHEGGVEDFRTPRKRHDTWRFALS